jgi:hypothetical protein
MSKPMTIVKDFVRGEEQADELKAAAKQYATNIERIYAQVGDHIRQNAELAARYGRDALLAQLPADVAASVAAVEGGLAQAWGALSDDAMPEIPAQPVVEESQPVQE